MKRAYCYLKRIVRQPKFDKNFTGPSLTPASIHLQGQIAKYVFVIQLMLLIFVAVIVGRELQALKWLGVGAIWAVVKLAGVYRGVFGG